MIRGRLTYWRAIGLLFLIDLVGLGVAVTLELDRKRRPGASQSRQLGPSLARGGPGLE